MNGSAGLKVVILVAVSGRLGDLAQRIEQRLEHEAVEERRDEDADGRGDQAHEQALAQFVEVFEQRQAVFGGERHAPQASVAAEEDSATASSGVPAAPRAPRARLRAGPPGSGGWATSATPWPG